MDDKQIKHVVEQEFQNFTQSEQTKESKRRMFYNIMDQALPGNTVTYAQAEESAEALAKPPKKPIRFPTFTWGFGAVAALFALVLISRMPITTPTVATASFNPPLTQSDVPKLVAAPQSRYRTVATNNNFYLGFAETDYRVGTLEVLVHSRSDEIDWDTLSTVDLDNDQIQPIAIDKNNNIVSLPVSESEIVLEVKDKQGNCIECVIPTYI